MSRDFHFSFYAHILKGISLAISEIKITTKISNTAFQLRCSDLTAQQLSLEYPQICHSFPTTGAFASSVTLQIQNNAECSRNCFKKSMSQRGKETHTFHPASHTAIVILANGRKLSQPWEMQLNSTVFTGQISFLLVMILEESMNTISASKHLSVIKQKFLVHFWMMVETTCTATQGTLPKETLMPVCWEHYANLPSF